MSSRTVGKLCYQQSFSYMYFKPSSGFRNFSLSQNDYQQTEPRPKSVKNVTELSSHKNHSIAKRNHTKRLTLDTINQDIRNMTYAVKGPLVVRAAEIEGELRVRNYVVDNQERTRLRKNDLVAGRDEETF